MPDICDAIEAGDELTEETRSALIVRCARRWTTKLARAAMQTLESLSDALETTADIQSLVRTMKALSAASIRQFERAEEALADYERTIELGLTAVLHDRRARGQPLPRTGETGPSRAALIVIGSERGLCGRYNETIARFASDRIEGPDTLLAVLGVRAAARLEAEDRRVDTVFTLPGSVGGLSDLVQSVIVQSDRWQREGGVGRIHVVHNRREGRTLAQPVERQLLPLPEAYLKSLLDAPWPGRGCRSCACPRPRSCRGWSSNGFSSVSTARWPRRWPASTRRGWRRCRAPSAISRSATRSSRRFTVSSGRKRSPAN